LNNLAGGVYDLQGDGDLLRPGSGYAGAIHNAGTFRKSAGTGESVVDNFIPFNNTGIVEVDSGTLSFKGGYTQTAGQIALHGTTLKSTSVLDIQGGAIQGSGTIEASISNKGTISPGFSAGTINVLGNLTLLDGSGMIFDIGGHTQGTDFDFLNVTSTTALNGSLSLDLLNGFEQSISPTETFAILDTGSSLTGVFTNIANGQRLTTLDGLGSFQVNYGAASLYGSDKITLSNFQAVPEPSTLLMGLSALVCLSFFARRHGHTKGSMSV
jgi:hypothetical protein